MTSRITTKILSLNSTALTFIQVQIIMVSNAVDIIQITLYGFVFISGTIGNAFVVRWFGAPSEIGKAGNKLVVVLAVNDFFSSIFYPFYHIHYIVRHFAIGGTWHLGKFFCHSLLGLYLTFLYATSFLLVAISIERFR